MQQSNHGLSHYPPSYRGPLAADTHKHTETEERAVLIERHRAKRGDKADDDRVGLLIDLYSITLTLLIRGSLTIPIPPYRRSSSL